MLIKIFTLKDGLKVIENVNAVRIKSKEYNLLILRDYVASLGKIEGSVEIETTGNTEKFENLSAYYVCYNNVFNLMIEGE